jgi:septum formation protein
MNPASLWHLRGITNPIILASASPRRADILQALGLPFRRIPSDIREGDYGSWDGGDKLRQRALKKARMVGRHHPDSAVLSADTIVLLDQDVLGKPTDREQARNMLERLSGRWHEVWTALCVRPPFQSHIRTTLCTTRVLFRILAKEEIQRYVETGEPLDKAGAYGIQGTGGLWVREIQGCYFNVVGLPVSELWDLLNQNDDASSSKVRQP